jgi:hypothetical protein
MCPISVVQLVSGSRRRLQQPPAAAQSGTGSGTGSGAASGAPTDTSTAGSGASAAPMAAGGATGSTGEVPTATRGPPVTSAPAPGATVPAPPVATQAPEAAAPPTTVCLCRKLCKLAHAHREINVCSTPVPAGPLLCCALFPCAHRWRLRLPLCRSCIHRLNPQRRFRHLCRSPHQD